MFNVKMFYINNLDFVELFFMKRVVKKNTLIKNIFTCPLILRYDYWIFILNIPRIIPMLHSLPHL